MKANLLIAALLSALCCAAQNHLVKFDLAQPDGSVLIDLGKITRTQANGYTISVFYTNGSNQTLYANSETTAWNDVSDIGHYACRRVAVPPKGSGCFRIALRLGQKQMARYSGNLDFTDSVGKVLETFGLRLRAEIYDSLLPIQTTGFVKFTQEHQDSLGFISFGRLKEQQLQGRILKVSLKNASPYSIVVKNKKKWRVSSGILADKDTMMIYRFGQSLMPLPGDTLKPAQAGYLLLELDEYEGVSGFRRVRDTLRYTIVGDGGILENRSIPYGAVADFEGNQFEVQELPDRQAIYRYCNRKGVPDFTPNDSVDFRAIVLRNISGQEVRLELPRNPEEDHTGFRFFDDQLCAYSGSFTLQRFINTVAGQAKEIILAPYRTVFLLHGVYGPMLRSKDGWSRTILMVNGKKRRLAAIIRSSEKI